MNCKISLNSKNEFLHESTNYLLEMLQLQLAERERAEKNTKEQVHFLQTLIDAIPCPVFYKDEKAVYQGCNKAFESYIGLSREQLIGKSVYDLAPLDLADKYHEMDESLLCNPGIQVYESSIMYADKTRHSVIFNKATYCDTNGVLKGLVGIALDITERKKVEEELEKTTAKLQVLTDQIVQAMATMAETRDPYTAGHQQRVAELAAVIAREIGFDEHRQHSLRMAGLLHDVGKIVIPGEILSKPGKISTPEFEIIKGHVQAGYDILCKIDFPTGIAEFVLQHHERLDGSGYPRGLKGNEISLESQILAVADVVEAMSSHRPYRPSLGLEKALEEISLGSGKLYNPEVARACLAVLQKESSID